MLLSIIFNVEQEKEPDQVSTSKASTSGSGSIANIKYISHDDEYKTTLEMEYNYYVQVSLEFKEKAVDMYW